MKRVTALLSGLAVAGCSVIGVRSGTEEPSYTVTAHVGDVEIRQYGPRIAAESILDGDEQAALGAGFRRIAGYIFGANAGSTKIAMTAPVAQAPEKIAMTAPVAQARDADGRWVVRFFMPAGSTLANLPTPNDPKVRLVELPPETMAVLRFTGLAGAASLAEHRASLLATLQSSSWHPTGTPVAWYYDPPWTIPFLRRNEVAVPVASGG